MNHRHALSRKPRKDRDVTWSRSIQNGVTTWTLWRRDHRRAIHLRAVTQPGKLRGAWHELRDFVDTIDLQAMEETA